MSVSPFEHPLLSALLGDDKTASFFSLQADIEAMLSFEVALTTASAAEGVVPRPAAEHILSVLKTFTPDLGALAQGVARDGVVVPELIRQIKSAVGGEAAQYVHFGSTSQDVIDCSLFMRTQKAFEHLRIALDTVIAKLAELTATYGTKIIMGHTRMQVARPISIAHKLSEWQQPLSRYRDRMPSPMPLQLGGAVGNRAELGDKAQAVADRMSQLIGLAQAMRAYHTEREGVADMAHWLSLVSGTLGKLGQDVVLMTQNEVAQATLSSGGRSSAMPGKANPVPAEILVTLARFNATQIAGIHSALVHEYERSGAAWTLEWMLLPQMFVATGAALRTANTLLNQLDFPS